SAAGAARVLARFPNWRDEVSANVAAIGETGGKLAATEYVNMLDRLTRIRSNVSSAWQDFDVLLTPTAATLPFPVGEAHPAMIDDRPATLRSASIFTTWVNAVGYP